MYSAIIILSLAVFGANAACCGTVSCGPALQGPTCFGSTPVIENPTRVIPSVLPSTSVSQSCHCMKTIVRPQIRNEIITSPSVDRIVRYVPSPVVEAVSVNTCPSTRTVEIPTCGGCVNTRVNTGVFNAGYGLVNTGCGVVNTGCGVVNTGCGVVNGLSGFVGGYQGLVSGAGCSGDVSAVFPSSVVGTGCSCNNLGLGYSCGNVVSNGCGNFVSTGCGNNFACGCSC